MQVNIGLTCANLMGCYCVYATGKHFKCKINDVQFSYFKPEILEVQALECIQSKRPVLVR